jgi:hypothetical protein
MQEVEDDYGKFNDGYSSYLKQVDVKDLSGPLEEINKLTYTYNRFHKLPDQVQQLKENELKKRIASVFEVDHNHVNLDKYQEYIYRFEITNQEFRWRGGCIFRLSNQYGLLRCCRYNRGTFRCCSGARRSLTIILQLYSPLMTVRVLMIGRMK